MSGSLEFEIHTLPTGEYKLYYLADDSYSWLAAPITVTLGDTYNSKMALLSSEPLVIKYQTDRPDPHNWIALYYRNGGAPINQEFNKFSLNWKYAPLEHGTVQLSTIGLTGGMYSAYFMASDGYQWLSEPIELSLNGTVGYIGTLEEDYKHKKRGKVLAYKYHAPQPNDKNWIGIWRYYDGGPEHEAFNKEPLLKQYAPGLRGTVEFNASKLEPGPFKAYFLEDDSYRWLAEPVSSITRKNTPFRPMTQFFTGPTLRVGEPVNWSLAGTINHGVDTRNTFSIIVSKYDWAWVTKDGRIIGTPTPDSQGKNLTVEVFVTGSEDVGYLGNWMIVSLPVARNEDPVVKNLRMISLNMKDGGKHVEKYNTKQYIWFQLNNVDVVTMQSTDGYHGARVATALGWHVYQGDDVAILSKYPIVQVYQATPFAAGVRIALEEGKSEIIVWTAHLTNQTYGPQSVCVDKVSMDEALQREEDSGRPAQLREVMEQVKGHLATADSKPVFLTGDFNAPSHLDWTNNNTHCGFGNTSWPTSLIPTEAGMVDVFRAVNSNPQAEPGITTLSPNVTASQDGGDRIDFIYYKGSRAVPAKAQAIMTNDRHAKPGRKENRWWTDHKAVFAEFTMQY
ncbi:hypothetical protein VHEMI08317 [[Torrubiella] hemipterigena]|uniref:Endonuclease/exonuclease/phosphatase domain-containing protein n=1 Tax=[Torrubiella] hemipterigena TaxID=1531966 RepID=A0A0A1TNB7_9HYPO|nr:hypothetical protein VHEMI08317 [[Torrubiella] hemipterigena]